MRTETYSTPGPLLLNLEIPAGEIEIDTSNTDETHIELEAVSNNDAVRDLVDNSRIELVRRGDGHEVIVEAKSRQGIFISLSRGPDIRFGGPDVRLRITCPKGADLDVRTKSADLRARGEYGGVEIKTASGDLRAQLVSGDVHVRDARASIGANTVSGDQNFEAVLKGRIELKAISGDVTVGIRSGARVFVDANTVSGSTSSELDLGDAPAQEPAPDSPLVEVFAKTVSGDVRIERAPALVEATEQS